MKLKVSGKPICSRISSDSTSATSPTPIATLPYWIAMTLWSWLQTYFSIHVWGSCMGWSRSAIATYAMTDLPFDEAGELEPPDDVLRIASSAQRIDVRDDVLDGVLADEHVRDQVHLVSVNVVRVATAYAGLEILELPLEVPVAHAREARSVRAPAALPCGAVTRRAREVQRAPTLDVAARHL